MTSRIAAVLPFLFLTANEARAQQSVSDVLRFLVTNQGVETGSVERDQAAAQATSDTISRAIQANLATLPVSTSSGAFVYRLNQSLGTVERASQTFGPSFVERAFTVGRNRSSLGLSVQYLRFNALDGNDLRDGTLITTANKFTDEAAPFDVDRLTLNIDASVATLYGSVGVGDRVEIGVAAPLVSLRVDGSRVNTYRGTNFTQARASATTIGLADVVVRTKVTAFAEEGAALAAGVEVRLPTGNQANLLGAGSASVRFSGIGSLETGPFSTHGNLGISVGGLATELSYGGAVAVAAGRRVTLTGELLGRWVDTPAGIVPVAAPHPTLVGVQTIRLVPGDDRLTGLGFVPGLKWNVSATWVLVANVSMPVTDRGLTTRYTPFFGVDYAFGR